jgi:acyl-CoA synthetase
MMLTLHDPQAAREHYLAGTWQQDTLYTLLRQHARARGSSVALRDPWRRLSWSEVLESVDRVAETLHRAGLRAGDRVAVWLPSRIESAIVLLACSRNGYVCCPSLHQSYTVRDVVALLNRVRCRALFTMPGYGADGAREDIFGRLAEVPTLRRAYALDRPDGKLASLPAGIERYPDRNGQPAVMVQPDLNPDKVVYLAFTSGTTGLPKGVMHSDNTLLANGRALVRDWRHDERTVLLSLSPLSHHIGTVAIEQWLVAGMELVVHDAGAGKPALDWILETGATYVMGVPTHAMDILDAMRARGLDRLGQVNCFYMAGATIPRETAEQFVRLGIRPQNVYGMTENGSHQYTHPSDSLATTVGTCGRACSGYAVRLFSQEDANVEVPLGQVGEIGSRGGLLMLGYYDDQAATEDSFNRSGWFMSGDLGILDEQGCLQIVGRKKDLIIRGGHNIHPAHIEDLAHRHPGIAKAAAFPVADTRLGEKVCLAVIARAGVALDAQQVLQHLYEAGLSKFDMPEYFLAMPAFPLTASGKILKRELKDWAAQGRIAPEPVRWRAPSTEESRP